MHDKRSRTCFLCIVLNADSSFKDVLQEHHCIRGNANRHLSEKYGLKIYLCPCHHTVGPMAVHNNSDIREITEKAAQYAFEKHFPEQDFRKIFGRNYL